MVYLLLGLHADESLVLVEHRGWNIAGCIAGNDWLDGRGWTAEFLGSLGADEHRDPLAVSSFHGDCLVVQGSVFSSGL